ncbi:MAG TPA: hypothetical protein PLV92_25005 [Pirellulaceae bacterium]|nr:hypothetical protein [Pirellulaceae bacterium]
METTLHQQLKQRYATDGARQEVVLGDYRIDVVKGDEQLIEIQHGSLAAIRDKIGRLLKKHDVLVVKPLVIRKQLVLLDRRGGRVVSRRGSPKRGQIWDLFHELVYFTRVFPHPRLVLEVPLVEIEEWRFPGHGRRRRWRSKDHVVEDQRLTKVESTMTLRTVDDLLRLLPSDLPCPFHTGHLAESAGMQRWVAQRVAYCLRKTGAVVQDGKQGNALLYRIAAPTQVEVAATSAAPKRTRLKKLA